LGLTRVGVEETSQYGEIVFGVVDRLSRIIVVGGLPVHHYRAEDAVAEAYAMVFLVESGFAQQMLWPALMAGVTAAPQAVGHR
jgi:hypothetical protein